VFFIEHDKLPAYKWIPDPPAEPSVKSSEEGGKPKAKL